MPCRRGPSRSSRRKPRKLDVCRIGDETQAWSHKLHRCGGREQVDAAAPKGLEYGARNGTQGREFRPLGSPQPIEREEAAMIERIEKLERGRRDVGRVNGLAGLQNDIAEEALLQDVDEADQDGAGAIPAPDGHDGPVDLAVPLIN